MSAGLLLYDADCGFCTRSIRWVPRLGLRVEVASLQSQDLGALGVSPTRALEEIPLVSPVPACGTSADARRVVYYGGEAVARALGTGNVLWRGVSRALMAWPVRLLVGRVYRTVARHRQRLPGGTPACARGH